MPDDRRRFPTLSLRARLLLLFALAALPILADRGVGLLADRQRELQLAEDKALQLAHHAASTQQTVLDEARLFLAMLSRTLAGVDDASRCSGILQAYASDVPWLRNVYRVSGAGEVDCSSRPALSGVNVADRAYFQDARRTGEFTVSDYLLSRVDRQPTVTVALPNTDPAGTMRWLLVAALDLTAVSERLASIASAGGVSLFMVDAKGTIVAAFPASARLLGRSTAELDLESVEGDSSGIVDGTSPDGTPLMVGFAPVEGTLFRVGIAVPRAGIDAALRTGMLRSLLEVLGLGALLGLAVWLGGERLLISPARRFAATAERLGAGDLKARARTIGLPAELVPPALAFNAMADRIAERDAALTEANRRLLELASQDGLTGLANRRHFDEALRTEWERAAGERSPVAIASVAVDHFKRFNDAYGHLAGDDALRRVAEVLRVAARRPGDVAARIGGEEFALLLPQTSAAGAAAIAENARAMMEAAAIPHAGSEHGRLSLSIGVAALVPTPDAPVVTLLSAADEALYGAKRTGRNRVSLHRPQAVPRLVAGA
jgi:diguanylate cyclase (GGDEF)-like protein